MSLAERNEVFLLTPPTQHDNAVAAEVHTAWEGMTCLSGYGTKYEVRSSVTHTLWSTTWCTGSNCLRTA